MLKGIFDVSVFDTSAVNTIVIVVTGMFLSNYTADAYTSEENFVLLWKQIVRAVFDTLEKANLGSYHEHANFCFTTIPLDIFFFC